MTSIHTVASFTSEFMGVLFVLVVFGVVVVMLQMFLSKTESKWNGLIMPIVMFGISLAASYQFALRAINTRSFTGMINGVHIEYTTSIPSIIVQTALIFILCNIATGVFISIYAVLKRRTNQQRALEMMSIQDLG
ncbi:MAG: hypothetical protein FWB96_07045 [Defluviitaleaceae bacterium]|nr:hypothetical protein [Defluviitaleaceae bacterium]MCL2262975.1 hypothetical protein [Defluviitaleaceae bacterium]